MRNRLSQSLISEYPGYSLISEPITAREKHYSLVGYMLMANSQRDEVEVTIAIFTEPEVTNCFSKIALVIIRENRKNCSIYDSETSTNLAAILKTESRHCCNHLAVITARERTKFSTNQCPPFSIITSAILLIPRKFTFCCTDFTCRAG